MESCGRLEIGPFLDFSKTSQCQLTITRRLSAIPLDKPICPFTNFKKISAPAFSIAYRPSAIGRPCPTATVKPERGLRSSQALIFFLRRKRCTVMVMNFRRAVKACTAPLRKMESAEDFEIDLITPCGERIVVPQLMGYQRAKHRNGG